MHFVKAGLFALAVLTAQSGCSRDDSNSTNNSSDHTAPNNDHVPGTVPFIDRALVGVWDGPCVESGIYTPFYERVSFDFRTGGGLVRQRRVFAEATCQTSIAIESLQGQWNLSTPIRLADTAHHITFKVLFFGIQTNSALGAANFNSKSLCGFTNWNNGLSRNVTGVECVGYTWSQNDIVLDVVTIREPHLYFGRRVPDGDGHFDLKGRPSEMNMDAEYLRR